MSKPNNRRKLATMGDGMSGDGAAGDGHADGETLQDSGLDGRRLAVVLEAKRGKAVPARRPTGGQSRRGMSIMPIEDAMLTAIMRYDNPRVQNRSETFGNMIRLTYELLLRHGLMKPDPSIPPIEYEGWIARWRLEAPTE